MCICKCAYNFKYKIIKLHRQKKIKQNGKENMNRERNQINLVAQNGGRIHRKFVSNRRPLDPSRLKKKSTTTTPTTFDLYKQASVQQMPNH